MLPLLRSAALLAALLAVVAPPARAVTKEVGGYVGGARGVFAGGYFTEPSDVAVYHGGVGGARKLYVVEAAAGVNNRVQRLDANGNFELAWGRDVVRRGALGDRGLGSEICRSAHTCKAAPPGARAGELRTPTAVAVDNSSGDVYVMDSGNRRVQRFDHDGRFIAAWGWGVASGAPRFEVCERHCRSGRVGGPEGDSNPGQIADSVSVGRSPAAFPTGAIAVDQRPPRHVFVGDEGNSRVLELTPEGDFVRAWGWGVATGSRTFEACTRATGCRAGKQGVGGVRPGDRGLGGDGWPRHLAVDHGGVVYASEAVRDSGVVRFSTKPPPDPPSAKAALLPPFTVDDLLDAGFNLGIAFDEATGELVVARNPFGPMAIDEVSNPGAPLRPGKGASAPSVAAHHDLDFLGSVNGIDSYGGTVYLAKSTRLDPNDPDGDFDGCSHAGRRGPCNGVAVVASKGVRGATLTGAVASDGEVTVLGSVAAHGVARYVLQLSSDGRSWRSVGRSRSIVGGGRISLRATSTRPVARGLYQARLAVAPSSGPARADRILSNRIVITRY